MKRLLCWLGLHDTVPVIHHHGSFVVVFHTCVVCGHVR